MDYIVLGRMATSAGSKCLTPLGTRRIGGRPKKDGVVALGERHVSEAARGGTTIVCARHARQEEAAGTECAEAGEGEQEESEEGQVTLRRVQMNMQAEWRRVFAIVLGVLIWTATVALLEACIAFSVFWKNGGMWDDISPLIAFVFCLAALPFIVIGAMPIAWFACAKVMPVDRIRQDG
jgi:hypothetical protein